MLMLDRMSDKPLYEQIYQYIRDGIESGQLPAGTKLPSVRALAAEKGVSKITVEQAYIQLAAEGYIKAHNRSPYEVLPLSDDGSGGMNYHHHSASIVNAVRNPMTTKEPVYQEMPPVVHAIQYDFATGAMDPEGFDYARWKRYIGYVLRSPDRLMGYGDAQGETELRHQLVDYLRHARGVMAQESQIVVGSGTQSSVTVIASLLKQAGVTAVAIDKTVFAGVAGVFSDYGFRVVILSQADVDLPTRLTEEGIEAIYCMPSHGDRRGAVMSVAQRHSLLRWAAAGPRYIIEDDYDSELRYYGRPMMSLFGLDTASRVIYLGTPSKVLPPAIRLSYMVLPPSLAAQYQLQRNRYRQSAGVMEQLVWAGYIEAGEWSKQIRRLRKHYHDKSKYMVRLLQDQFGDMIDVTVPAGGVYIAVTVHRAVTAETLLAKAAQHGCAVKADVQSAEDGVAVLLSFSAIPTKRLAPAVAQLARAWKGL